MEAKQTKQKSGPRAILSLVIVHLLATFVVVVMSLVGFHSLWLDHVTFVLTSTQLALVAIWTAFVSRNYVVAFFVATMILVARMIVMVAPQFYQPFNSFSPIEFLVTTVVINRLGRFAVWVVILALINHWVFAIRITDESNENARPLQFQLWHLMLFTFLSAVGIFVAKGIFHFFDRPFIEIYNDSFLFLIYNLVFLLIGTIYSLTVAMVATWATLGTPKLVMRIAVAIIIVILMSPLWPLLSQQQAVGILTQTMVTVYETSLLIVSLLVFRRVGYRMVNCHETQQPIGSS